jgi:hypothetical protein
LVGQTPSHVQRLRGVWVVEPCLHPPLFFFLGLCGGGWGVRVVGVGLKALVLFFRG